MYGLIQRCALKDPPRVVTDFLCGGKKSGFWSVSEEFLFMQGDRNVRKWAPLNFIGTRS